MTKPKYDFVDATFHFFKVAARRPMAALWIGFWQMVLVCVLTVMLFIAFWPVFTLALENDMTDDALVVQTLLRSSGLFTLVGIGFLLLSLAAQGAWLRLLTRDEIKPVFPFRLGLDELRLFGVNAVFVTFWFVGYLAVLILFLGGAALLGGIDGAGGIAVGALVGTLLVLVGAVLLIILCLRFAAAPALSVHDRGFRLFSAIPASKGVAGMMFLSYLTLIGVWIAGYIVVSMIQQVAVLFAASDLVGAFMALETASEPDPSEILALLRETLTSPLGIVMVSIVVIAQFIFQIAFEGLWHGVGAYVARRRGAAEAVAAPASADSANPSSAPDPEPAG
ncbi:MAG: hypothetical protein LAT81_04605 [Oceanicaulis sp.]|nr:hypothetical protein [Oceanicaulis sp.]